MLDIAFATIVAASIAAVASVLTAVIARSSRRSMASEHLDLLTEVRVLSATVEAWHADDMREHDIIREQLAELRNKP